MAIGTVLVGVALTAVVVAYLARPFRVVGVEDDRAIEVWVSRVREEGQRSRGAGEQGSKGAGEQGSKGARAQGSKGAGEQGRKGAREQGSKGAGEQGRKGAREQRSREGEEINFCPQCGRQVGPDDRFCAGCGTRLRGG